MTELLYSPKIKPEHLARKAIVYLRQSTEKQVRENQESQRLQYDLGDRMRALGWKDVEIIGHVSESVRPLPPHVEKDSSVSSVPWR
jgi:transketolase N-terminal domain/subunit